MSVISDFRARHVGWLFGIFAAGAAHAQTIVPTQADICDPKTEKVDKQALATFLLDAKPVSRKLENWVAKLAPDDRYTGLSAGMRMIVDKKICAPLADDTKPPCAKDDAKNLAELRGVLINLLSYQEVAYENEIKVFDPAEFFKNEDARLTCRKSPQGQVVEAGGAVAAKFTLEIPFRIRAVPDGLHFARTDAAPFKALDKATISFSQDYEKNKRTEKFAIAVGYPIGLVKGGLETFEIVPYFGISRDIAKVEGKDDTITADLLRFGTVFDYSITGNGWTQWIVARPEYVINDKDKSETVAMNLTYQPFKNGLVNDYIRLIKGRDDFASFQPIFDLRLNLGHFAKQGDRANDVSHDFVRLGTMFGVAFTSDYAQVPIDITVTKTWLPALNSGLPDLDYFKAIFAFGLFDDRRFGVDVSYVNGRRDDLLDKEKSWTIGFGLKF